MRHGHQQEGIMDNMKFQGFPKEGLKFLANLKRNNTREWFTQYKALYQETVEAPAKAFVFEMEALLATLSQRPMSGKVFRIYRDVRFSKDKTPYNTHVHMAFFSTEGHTDECGAQPAFHFGLEPRKLTLGIGNFGFPKGVLDAYRQAVDNKTSGRKLETLLRNYPESKGFHLQTPELKRVPAGYEKDHPRAELLRRKGLVLWHEQTPDDVVHTPKSARLVLKQYQAMKPIYAWLNAL